MSALRRTARLAAALGFLALTAFGLASGDQITDGRWLAILGAAWLLLVLATWVRPPAAIPTVGRTTIRTAVVLATVFAVVSLQLLRIQIVTREATADRVAIAPNGDVAGNPRRQQADLRVQRGRVYDRNGVILADSVREGELWRRVYPEPESAYVVGYYAPLQYGTTGLEATYDAELTGQSTGSPLTWLERDVLHQPQQGDDLILTLDAGLQRTAHALLDGRTGAAVLIDVRTGAVLVLASNPSWDPNALFAASPAEAVEASAYWQALTDDPALPLVTRATSGLYPPGSTFKVVTAGAAIEAGFTTPDEVYEDDGDLDIDGRVIVENNRPDPSQTEWTLTEGLVWSLNVVFAQVGLQLGPEQMRDYASAFGFGDSIPFDLPVAISQLEITPGYIDNPVALADTAFGQGQLLATPLQMALVAASYANGGVIPEPYLVDRVVTPDGQVIERAEPERWRQPVSAETAAQTREMMIASASDGYAAGAAIPGLVVGGKTGTAETGDGEPHAWFIGFAGDPAPRYAVAVVLEHGGSGLAGALTVGRDLLATAFGNEVGSRAPDTDPTVTAANAVAPTSMYVRGLRKASALSESRKNGRIRHARSGDTARRATSTPAIRTVGCQRPGRTARRRAGHARQRRGGGRGRTVRGSDHGRSRPRSRSWSRQRRGRAGESVRSLPGHPARRSWPGLLDGSPGQDHHFSWAAGARLPIAPGADAGGSDHRRARAGSPPRPRRRPPRGVGLGMTANGGGSPTRSARTQVPELPAVPGVVESIANGLSLVLVYPALVLVPLAIDAIAWSGLTISPTSLAETSSSAADALASLGLEHDLTRLVGLFVPSLLSWVSRDRYFTVDSSTAFAPASWSLVAVAIVALLLIGALVHAAFRVPVAFVVRQQPLRGWGIARAITVAWLRLVSLALLALAVLALVAFPMAVAGGLLLLAGVNATPLLTVTVVIPAMLALVYFYFAPDAIAASEVGPLRACYLSFNVVRRNFWPVIGLIASIALISSGLPVLWLSKADHPIGLLIGVFCHALISTGLTMASMQFYLDRLGRWQRSPAGR